jgi:hypothetical protein
MKINRTILTVGCLSIILLTGINTAIACEGKTIGYWKNHTDKWVGYSTDQTLEEVFDLPEKYEHLDATLLEALSFKKGKDLDGAVRLLLKQAVAALLNIGHPDIRYQIGIDDLLYFVNRVLTRFDGMNRGYILSLQFSLDKWNNAGPD